MILKTLILILNDFIDYLFLLIVSKKQTRKSVFVNNKNEK